MFLAQCFFVWDCYELQVISFQIVFCFALRAMTGFEFVAAYNFDRNHHATFKTLWCNP